MNSTLLTKLGLISHTTLKQLSKALSMQIANGSVRSENCWNPSEFQLEPFALVVLNRPILVPNFAAVWNAAAVRHLVDGGTFRFLEWRRLNPAATLKSDPDFVTGDFDSCPPEAMTFARSLPSCQVIQTLDQSATDFTKALRVLKPVLDEREIRTVLALAETSGRLDHIMASINTLFKARTLMPDVRVVIMASNSLSWILAPDTTHVIHIPSECVTRKRWCALIPIAGRCVASSRGLKWNIDNTTLEFGGMVSTSNTYQIDTKTVEVTADNYLLWSMGVAHDDDEEQQQQI